MNWRKIAIYSLSIGLLGTIALAYLAQRNNIRIYGGLTTVVVDADLTPGDSTVCIYGVNVLAPDGTRFLPGRTVWIEKGLIRAIDTLPPPAQSIQAIDGAGKYLIPGLIDSHVHQFKSRNDRLLYVANGVTGIREMIGEPAHLDWRQAIAAGEIGPDMYIASPRLGSFGRVEGWFMRWTQGFNNAPNAAAAERLVGQFAAQGYDAVKVYSQLNAEAYEAIDRAASAAGLDIVGHVPWELELTDVLESNQSEIAHLEELMNAFRREYGSFDDAAGAADFLAYVANRSREVAPKLLANDISITTTLWLTQSFVRQKFALERVLSEVELAYANPGIIEWDPMLPRGLGWLPEVNRYRLSEELDAAQRNWQKTFWLAYGQACAVILQQLAEAGVSILAGTDANLPPAVPGFSLHDELEAMVAAGLSPSRVLRAATADAAAWLGHPSGTIVPGNRANLILLAADPLLDIRQTRNIHAVVLHGRAFDRPRLDELLAAVRTANDASRTVAIEQYVGTSVR